MVGFELVSISFSVTQMPAIPSDSLYPTELGRLVWEGLRILVLYLFVLAVLCCFRTSFISLSQLEKIHPLQLYIQTLTLHHHDAGLIVEL